MQAVLCSDMYIGRVFVSSNVNGNIYCAALMKL